MSSKYPANAVAAASTADGDAVITYEQSYSKQINLKMQVPQIITVADGDHNPANYKPAPLPDVTDVDTNIVMKVPQIITAVDGDHEEEVTPLPDVAITDSPIPVVAQMKLLLDETTPNGKAVPLREIQETPFSIEDQMPAPISLEVSLLSSEKVSNSGSNTKEIRSSRDAEKDIEQLQRHVAILYRRICNIEDRYSRKEERSKRWRICVNIAIFVLGSFIFWRRR